MNHWNTQSYAQHMALEGFYEDVLGPIDDLVETTKQPLVLLAEAGRGRGKRRQGHGDPCPPSR